MKSFKSTSLYSRLALITSVTLVVGYFVVYAWTTLSLTDVESNDTITSTLMQGIVNNINDLNTRVSNFSFSSGNVGIGTASPGAKLQINSTTGESIRMQYSGNSGFARLSTDIANSLILDTVNLANSVVIKDITGNVGIGTTTPSAKLTLGNNVSTAGPGGSYGNYQILLHTYTTPNTSYGLGISNGTLWFNSATFHDFYSSGVRVASISSNGTYSALSDKRYKTNINTLTGALDKINNLNGVSFNWKRNGKKDIGVIAQETEKVFPEIVSTDSNGYKSVAYSNLVAPLIEAVKELKSQKDAENQKLNAQILELKNEIRELKNK